MYDEVHLSLKDIPVNTPIIFIIPFNEIENINKKNIDSHELLKKAIKHGFTHPIISSQISKEKEEKKEEKKEEEKKKELYLCLFNRYDHRYGNKKDIKTIKKIEYSVLYCIKNYIKIKGKSKGKCELFINFSKKTINYLHDYTKKHKFRFKETNEQREISGKFINEPLSENSVLIEIEEGETDLGDKEKADYKLTVASFHTHPLEAYQKYSVCLAYPSTDDYVTILHIYSNHFGMFHITATVEGLYIITVKLTESQEKISKNFDKYVDYIEKYYSIDYPECDKNNIDVDTKIRRKQISSYLKKINKLKIFKVIFKSWEDALEPVKIFYRPIGNSCILSDEQVKKIKLF